MASSSTSNYWSQKLGFAEEDAALTGHTQLTSAAAASHSTQNVLGLPPMTSAAAPLQTEDKDLERWIEAFHERLAAKENMKLRKLNEQLNRDDEEIERWKAIRAEDERLVREKQLAQAREAAMAAAQKEQEEAAERERLRIEMETEGMTDEARAQWIADDQELQALEMKLQTKEERLASLDSVLKAGAAIYDAKVAAEAEAIAQAVAAVLRQEQALKDSHEEEQANLQRDEGDVRLSLVAEQENARQSLSDALIDGQQVIFAEARANILRTCSDETRKLIDSITGEPERIQLLDELALMATMRKTLKRLENGLH